MAKDFLLNTDGDLDLRDGDIAFDEADGQSLEALLFLGQGDLKYAPLTGVGIVRITNSKVGGSQILEGVIKQQLLADNWRVAVVFFDTITGDINVNALR
jgi:hypothetical protein